MQRSNVQAKQKTMGSAAGLRGITLQEAIERLFDKLRIAVIHGGSSKDEGSVIYRTHNPRSDKTYEAVARDIAEALQRLGFRHVELFAEDMNLGDKLKKAGIQFAWLNTGGTQGYAPTCHAAAMLELYGIPYVGHNPLNAALLDNKHAFKHLLRGLGIDTGRFMTWSGARGAFKPRINGLFGKVFGNYDGPFVVKPVSGRASLHVHVADSIDDLAAVVDEVYSITDNLVMIEEFVGGPEYCVAVTGPTVSRNREITPGGNAFSFSAVERVLESDERIFTSMDIKPITTDRVRLMSPERDGTTYYRLSALAQQVYTDCSLEAAVRLDIRADLNGRLFVLEANPKPDLKRPHEGKLSLICAGLPAEGMDYEDLILSMFADRLDFLLTHRLHTVGHITALLD